MSNGKKTFQSGLSENIRKYQLKDLVEQEKMKTVFLIPAQAFGMELLITCRHGEVFLATEKFQGFEPDVVNQPGDKVQVQNRTIAHVYADFANVAAEQMEAVRKWYQAMLVMLTDLLGETYLRTEAELYIAKLGENTGNETHSEKMDSLTGVCNQSYFQNRLKVIERSEVVPVAFIEANVNDTKFFYDTYGEEKGNRLLCIVAEVLKKCARDEYIIGRCGVDVFHVLIPLPEEGEAEKYCETVKEAVWACEDDVLAPSVAMGIVYKTNVEENFEDLLSDVEFEMLTDKMQIKQQPGYEKRKNKGL